MTPSLWLAAFGARRLGVAIGEITVSGSLLGAETVASEPGAGPRCNETRLSQDRDLVTQCYLEKEDVA